MGQIFGRLRHEKPPTPTARNRDDDQIDGLICPICKEGWTTGGEHQKQEILLSLHVCFIWLSRDVWTTGGEHQVCCLPCGHIYGKSCIKTWLLHPNSGGKCPQCNSNCVIKDIRTLYSSRIIAVDHEMQKQIRSLESKYDSLNLLHLLDQFESLKSERAVLRENNQELREKVRSLESQNASLKDNDQELQNQVRYFESKCASLEDKDQEYRNQVRSLESKCAALKKHEQAYQSEVAYLKSECGSFKRNNQELQHQVQILESKCLDFKTNDQELQKQVRVLGSKCPALERKVARLRWKEMIRGGSIKTRMIGWLSTLKDWVKVNSDFSLRWNAGNKASAEGLVRLDEARQLQGEFLKIFGISLISTLFFLGFIYCIQKLIIPNDH
ncbi:OLC1v1031805C1 [Oldenlandia corymbosa var. corymbosa]|uniref:OLC1v1031805C1 n=1 Tax=Oldenlandia corymbosa var. corymbosa TaxID=529605 RepID=A0AAV1CLC6_OLDCO|nr:OLC1v1031805C1 [Oldenlandia corymbosa var. corymbosa]